VKTEIEIDYEPIGTSEIDPLSTDQDQQYEIGKEIQPDLLDPKPKGRRKQELFVRPEIVNQAKKKIEEIPNQWKTLGYSEEVHYGVSFFKKPGANVQQYHCSACTAVIGLSYGYPFDLSPLKQHVTNYHRGPEKCKECGMRFESERLCLIHFNKVHRPILNKYSSLQTCAQCGKRFKTVGTLKTHLWKFHRSVIENESNNVSWDC